MQIVLPEQTLQEDRPAAALADYPTLDAKLVACWQAALNTDDPDESHRWVAMAEWLSNRDDPLRPNPKGPHPGERRRFPRVPVRSPALLTVGSLLLRGETVNLSRTGACIAVTGPEGLAVGDQGIVSVQGWVEDRAAEVVDISPGQVRLAFFGSRKR